MSPASRRPPRRPSAQAAEALVGTAPLVTRWMERLLAHHEPALTVAQLLALRAIGAEGVTGSELARRTGVSGAAVSQLVAGLVDAGLLERHAIAEDRRRQSLALSPLGRRVLTSAQRLVRERLTPLLDELPRPEAEALARALPHVEATLSGAPPPRRPPRPSRPPGPTAAATARASPRARGKRG